MNFDPREIDALYALLDDPDPTVQEALIRRSVELGEAAMLQMVKCVTEHHGMHSNLVHTLFDEVRGARAVQNLGSICENSYDMEELESAMWSMARFNTPDLDEARYRFKLDDIARTISVGAGLKASTSMRYLAMRNHVFAELGYVGERTNFQHYEHNFLNKVIDNRCGIPITLSVLVMLIGNRIGLPLRGIDMPMHFLVRIEEGMDDLFMDPYNHGALITYEDCRMLLEASGAKLTSKMLEPIDNRGIVLHIWKDLLQSYRMFNRPDEEALVRRILRECDSSCDEEDLLSSSSFEDDDMDE